MKYIAIIDDNMLNENDKRKLRVPILEKDGTSYVNLKPLVANVLTIKGGESIYLTQGDLVFAIYKMLEEKYPLIIEGDKENKEK